MGMEKHNPLIIQLGASYCLQSAIRDKKLRKADKSSPAVVYCLYSKLWGYVQSIALVCYRAVNTEVTRADRSYVKCASFWRKLTECYVMVMGKL
jgi:hypothetical protein